MRKKSLPTYEKERLANLFSYQILDSEEDEDYTNITQLASDICETPISLITFLDDTRQWFKSHTGLDIQETAKEFSFCAHAFDSPNEPFIIEDLSKDIRFQENPFVKEGPQFRFYAGIPVLSDEKMPLGTLCVMDYQPRILTEKQLAHLKKLSNQVEKLLKLRKAKINISAYQENLERQLAYNASLFKAIPDILMVMNFEGTILEVKSGKKDDFITNADDLIHRNIRDILPENVFELFQKKLKKIKLNQPFRLLEYKLTTIKGIQTFEANFAPFDQDKVLICIRNITNTKAIEEELFRTKDILLEAGKMAKVGAWEVDFINHRHLWSEVTKEIMELGDNPIPSVEEGINLYRSDPEGLEKLTKAFNKAIYEGVSYDLELKVTTLRGNEKWVRTNGKPIFENGNCVGVFGIFQDISAAKKNEDEILLKTAEYEYLFNQMNQGVVYQDNQGKIIKANPAAEIILGLSLDQMLGRTSIDPRWHAIHLDGSLYPGEEHPAMIALKSGLPNSGNVMGIFVPSTNSYRWILVDALPEFNDPKREKPYRVLATFTDISELISIENKLKANEAKLSSILESSSESIWSIDLEYNLIYVNETFKKLFKENFNLEIATNMNIIELLPEEIVNMWIEHYQIAFNGQRANFNFDLPNAGATKNYEVNIMPILVDKKVIGASIFAKDNTSNMVYIREIEEQNSKLREIAWKQSHLVRAPLARIMGLATLIKEEFNGTHDSSFLEHLLESTQELDEIIRSIVELSSPLKKS
ncbi:PAS domain S-box protein [Mongoliitalea daihaiensis]|uniref:PAS domain S-box protein n=1 Tax=Mongoliitalea daihaiensis TaxID=2782006 RepID=UPI001F30EA9F|nr:PAS domain S-box protein [Mongoliitalea daihaiensis]UJP63709.1 PAS domain S-box protein [Mongoliitalea daihaiensis]